MNPSFSLGYIADYVNGTLVGDADCAISGPQSIYQAGEGQIAFAEKGAALKALAQTKAAAVLVPMNTLFPALNLVQVENPRLAFAKILNLFNPSRQIPAGIHSSAVIGSPCNMGKDVAIAAGVVVGNGVTLGDRVVLHPNVTVGDYVTIGDDSIIYPNVAVLERCRIGCRVIIHAGTIIGSDGFGFVFDSGRHHKIPQIGIVQIDDDVEIGANCTIDRATMGKTWIKAGVKTDNLIQIAHNVEIGEHTIIVAQVGIAGSTTIGRHVILAGKAAIGGHLTLGDGVTIGGQCAVPQSVPDNQTMSGTTLAMPHGIWLRLQKVLPDLPSLFKRVHKLEDQLLHNPAEKGSKTTK